MIFAPPEPVTAAVAGTSERLAVRRIFCVGRNYAAHAREMGTDPQAEPPLFFTKWAETICPSGTAVAYPPGTADLQHEVELVAAIGKAGFRIAAEEASGHIFGYAVGLDLTRRDLQQRLRKIGGPWDIGKNFDCAAPLGPIHPAADVGHLSSGAIRLAVNGAVRQEADLSEMIWPVPTILMHLSRLYELRPDDLIYTGTPAGVGPLVPGDKLHASIAGLSELDIAIAETVGR